MIGSKQKRAVFGKLFSTLRKERRDMTKKTTRNSNYNANQQVLFLAFELGASKWVLGFSIGLGQKPRKRIMEAGDLEILQQEIRAAKKKLALSEHAVVKSCYESGRDGFWLHRYLTSVQVQNVIIDSSSIEVNRRRRRAKSDGLDVEGLLKLLIRDHLGDRKVWSVVRVPSVEDEDRRHLHRGLRTLKNEKTRTTNRLKGLLATQGIRMTRLDLSDPQLECIRTWDGKGLGEGLKSRLKREWERVLLLRDQIREVRRERQSQLKENKTPEIAQVKQLTALQGIGPESSWIIVKEMAWRDFRNRREVGSLIGLAPTPYDSGQSVREQGISKAGNRHVRAIAIELAWSWVRHQPKSKLTLWFMERFGGAGKRARKVGIVAVARRLMIDLWRFLQNGVIPDGARLKSEAA
jgi:transposase